MDKPIRCLQGCDDCPPGPTPGEIEASLESKFVLNREGSACRSAEELCEVLIDDAQALLGDSWERPDSEPLSDEDAYQALSEAADTAESDLNDAGYLVVHNDGYTIYKDLTDEEMEYLRDG